jgi:TatD DNase family protein
MELQYVDAHIHLSDEEYSEIIGDIVEEARKSNVKALVSNSMDLNTSIKSMEFAKKYPRLVYAALGIHPWNVNVLREDELYKTSEFILENRQDGAVVAVGEIGLDFKYKNIWEKQLHVFNEMLHLAERLDLPVIIHSRGTTREIVEMLPSYNIRKVLLHWFSNPISLLSKIIERGYYITEGPPAVYSSNIREIIQRIPLENFLTETDGPVRYFKSPFHGKLTTPAFVPMVVQAVAEIKKMSVADVAEKVVKNFENFFGVSIV